MVVGEGLVKVFTAWVDLLSQPTVKNLLVGEDGLYEVRQTPVGLFSVKVAPPERAQEGFELAVPPIPGYLFFHALTFFQFFARWSLECMVRFYYDGEKYFLYVPHQAVASMRVVALDYAEDIQVAQNNLLVCEMHSHHSMPACFSSIDDKDELATGIYGVIGEIAENGFAAQMRFSCGGHYRLVDKKDVFDFSLVGEYLSENELETWVSRVEKEVYLDAEF